MPRNLVIVVLICLIHLNVSSQNPGIPGQKPVAVIFDTDIGPDYDDVGAMALLHAFADKGECTILATIACNKYKLTAPVLDILNTYFNRPDLPVGVVRGNAVDIGSNQKWDSMLVARYPHDILNNEQAEDALTLYRKILGAAKDNSITIITVGFLTNLSNLLNSRPDQYSPLNGKELVKQKVKQLVSMAACFDNRMGAFTEFNVKMDAPASQNVFDNWPGMILFSGFEIGSKIFTGLPIVKSSISQSPVKDVFEWNLPLDPQDKKGRMSWDETAVLVAVRGVSNYFDLVPGKIISKPDGSNSWNFNEEGHHYLKEKMPVAEITRVLDELIMHQPGNN